MLMFTPKVCDAASERLKHRTSCVPLLFTTMQDGSARLSVETEKGKHNEAELAPLMIITKSHKKFGMSAPTDH